MKKDLNYRTLLIFAPVLILTGVFGFILPENLMSAAPAYNIFHILFGAIGLIALLGKKSFSIRGFNIGFGLIDLYQALASWMNWFPESFFRWKPADDVLHLVIGLVLVVIGYSTTTQQLSARNAQNLN